MRELSYRDAIGEALRQALRQDPTVFLMGEDIGAYGGVFGVTKGLLEEFGPERVMDTPISETSFGGIATGAAILGLRPVVEIMFSDFLLIAADGIFNQAAKQYYMSGGAVRVPVVFRTCAGAGGGAGAQHSQSLHALGLSFPGLKIAVPSCPYDAKGLLAAAIEDDDPVLFVENRLLYPIKADVPEEPYTIPFGKAAVVREGQDVTIVATFGMVARALALAEELAGQGISLEVIDPRTLCPLDKKAILDSVAKTGRLVTVDEGCKCAGVGSEIAAIVAEEAIEYLQAPIVRVAAPMISVPAGKNLDGVYVPDQQAIRAAVQRVMLEAGNVTQPVV